MSFLSSSAPIKSESAAQTVCKAFVRSEDSPVTILYPSETVNNAVLMSFLSFGRSAFDTISSPWYSKTFQYSATSAFALVSKRY